MPSIDPARRVLLERIALGGTSQGGVYEAVRIDACRRPSGVARPTAGRAVGRRAVAGAQDVIEQRNPRVIGINVSRTFAFSDGLSAGELEGMSEALGAEWTPRFRHAEALPLELIATRLPDEEAFFSELMKLV